MLDPKKSQKKDDNATDESLCHQGVNTDTEGEKASTIKEQIVEGGFEHCDDTTDTDSIPSSSEELPETVAGETDKSAFSGENRQSLEDDGVY